MVAKSRPQIEARVSGWYGIRRGRRIIMADRNDFADKVAIITGGASGIGAATVRLIVGRGGKAVIADIDDAAGRALADELGPAASFIRCDVSQIDSAKATVEAAIAQFGQLHCLFNNAGKPTIGTTPDCDPADWKATIDVTLNSVYYLCRAAIPHLKASGGGAIVNTVSVSGMFADYLMAAYNAAKGGVINYTRAMALDHADDNIRVNAVCPGLVWDTGMTHNSADRPGGWDPWTRSIPMRRGGYAIEVARVMVFLASDDASYITGAAIPVDGGLTAHTGSIDLRSLIA